MQSNEREIVPGQEFLKPLYLARVFMYGLSILSALLFLSLPLVNLLHTSGWQRSIGTIHGFAALGTTVITVYTGHLAFPLLRGVSEILPQIRVLAFSSTLLTGLGIITGNIAYMRYRAGLEFGGARAWLIENTPLTQYILMEYHEFTLLFTLPLGVACTWILWRYGDGIQSKSHRQVLAATCIGLLMMMFFALGGLVTGLGVAKIHAL
ncbi:MAG: hypothetical protein N5P05_001350 [Chroococcopsis gigantea SAG 12.99]|jgi:hypothetical protein|nr:hypothetical protein [Chlorogloea purpurea SAG 13.99]MDV2999744.1 hypothetical protein [Chroococcopsis gigantea SAG 12.99]